MGAAGAAPACPESSLEQIAGPVERVRSGGLPALPVPPRRLAAGRAIPPGNGASVGAAGLAAVEYRRIAPCLPRAGGRIVSRRILAQ